MLFKIYLFIAHLIFFGFRGDASNILKNIDSKTYGGEKVEIEDAPYVVLVYAEINNQTCTGSIITVNFVMSAAHCLKGLGEQDSLYIFAGTNTKTTIITDKNNGIRVLNYNKHPEFKPNEQFFDICLLELEKPLQISSKIDVIKFDNQPWPTINTRTCTAIGFGKNKFRDNFLRESQFLIDEPKKSCACISNNKLICAKATQPKDGICFGDSGGPLICDGVLTGVMRGIFPSKLCEKKETSSIIFSFFQPCGREGTLNVFTAIYPMNSWINGVLEKFSKKDSIPVSSSNSGKHQLNQYLFIFLFILLKCE